MTHRRVLIALTAAFVLTLSSCYKNKVYNNYHHTQIAGWEKNDTLYFDIPPLTRPGTYAMRLGLRTNNAYPFMGLSLIVESTVYPGKAERSDTLNCSLVDSNGNVKGQGVSFYQFNYHVTTLQLHSGDSLHVMVRHDMKREILPGISDVGIELTRQ